MNALYCTIQALLADSGVAAIVGTRIDPVILPERQILPSIVVNQITNMDEHLLGGRGLYPDARVRIECLGRSATQVIDLGDAVDTALTDLSGTFAGMAVKSFIKEELDETDSEESYKFWRRILDYRVRYRSA